MLSRLEDHLRTMGVATPKWAAILGSGIGPLVDRFSIRARIPYRDVVGLRPSSVAGHASEVVVGEDDDGRTVLAFAGQRHYYEGDLDAWLYAPIDAMRGVGVERVLIVSAIGGIHHDERPGDVILVDDIVDLMFRRPAAIPAWPSDVTSRPVCEPALMRSAVDWCVANRVRHRVGTLACMTGPTYETPAEIAMLRFADCAGVTMSMAPEVQAARVRGLSPFGVGIVANVHGTGPVTHEEVLDAVASGARAAGGLWEHLLTQ